MRYIGNTLNLAKLKKFAKEIWQKFRLKVGDHNILLINPESFLAQKVGANLRTSGLELPDIIFVSPCKRTRVTFSDLKRGWPKLEKVKWLEEERIRELEHGLALIYNDKKVFEALNFKQRLFRIVEGSYWYNYPQGEKIAGARERNHSWLGTLIKEFAEKSFSHLSSFEYIGYTS